MHDLDPLRFAKIVTDTVNEKWASGEYLSQVTDTTKMLLDYWFNPNYSTLREINFHEGQKQAILNIIYIHEVLKSNNLREMYQHFYLDALLSGGGNLQEVVKKKYLHPKYCIKMATGTGKTWVLSALLIWQYLNSKYEQGNYSRNFLLVAPGLIVYSRLLDAFKGKETSGSRERSFATSDIYQYKELFLPEEFREEVFNFVRSSVVDKEELINSSKTNGVIAITNYHLLLQDAEEESSQIGTNQDLSDFTTKGFIRPGTSGGNELQTLDGFNQRSRALEYLRQLTNLVVFNDEAHHIHDIKKAGEVEEVEWQKSLNYIAENKSTQFIQIDFTATPYNQKGDKKVYFPHIVIDFELKKAIRQALVKTLTLDRRKEIASLELDFKALRDESGEVTGLSDGQKIMLRAGLTRRNELEKYFQEISTSPNKHPKMLVMCEDTKVAPYVTRFLIDEGLEAGDVIEIHSNKQGEVSQEEWAKLKNKLFNIDSSESPKAIVSVAMLREGFDVNNICVIVPLRSTESKILLEQTIGRGLRLMWRGDTAIDSIRKDNIKRFEQGQQPKGFYDLLFIVEHPKFIEFYKELTEEGLIGIDDGINDPQEAIGDIIKVELVDGYEKFDFKFPVIVNEGEYVIGKTKLTYNMLQPYALIRFDDLKSLIGKGERFVSEEVTSGTRFGDYSVSAGVFSATSYNDYIARLVNRISSELNAPINKRGFGKIFPKMQINLPQITAIVDQYVKKQLFNEEINYFENENWRVLLYQDVTHHIMKEVSRVIVDMQQNLEEVNDIEVVFRLPSEVPSFLAREIFAIPSYKCIYSHVPFSSVKGGLEREFIYFCEHDSLVNAFLKVKENKHIFLRLRYIREDGYLAYYYPDFLIRIDDKIYMVETKAQDQVNHPNVVRKQISALNWVEKINSLPSELRDNKTWHYVLLGEDMFYDFRNKRANILEMLEFAKLRNKKRSEQTKLV